MTTAERAGAAIVQAAPLLGIPFWLIELQLPSNSWNFPLLFALGLFMLTTGLVVPAIAWFLAKSSFLRAQAVNALRFHGVIALPGILLCIAFAVAIQFDPPNPTMSNPPAHGEAIGLIGVILYGFIVPIVELIRAIVCARRAWRQSI